MSDYPYGQNDGVPEAPASYNQAYGNPQPAPYGAAATESEQAAAHAPARPAQKAAEKKSGGGRSFGFGFLGALLACALAFGAFGIWQSSNGGQAPSADGAQKVITLGGSGDSAFVASGEDPTLAEVVAAKALPSVVCIYVYTDQSAYYYGYGNSGSGGLVQSSLGSGIILSTDGYVLTNYHVVEGADALKVNVAGEELDASLVGSDPSSDLAVIKIENAEGLVAADIGDSDNLTVGEWVMSIGAPFGLEQSVATGVVSATSRSQIYNDTSTSYYFGQSGTVTIYPNMIQTDAAINPGNSGGALVDAEGKVIGVNTLITSSSGGYSGVGFAIPINYAINIAQQIIDGKTPTHAKLGVSLTTINDQIARRHNLPTNAGAYVSVVSAGSGADEAGLREGDIIVSVEGKKVTSATDVTLAVREHNPGDTLKLTVNREGQTVELEVVLGSDEADLVAAAAEEQQPSGGSGRDPLWEYLFGN